MREVVIVGAARTPIGSFQGELAPLKAPELGEVAIAEALERAGASPGDVDEVFMGCVLPAGVGQAPARQASIFAGLPNSGAVHHDQQGVRLGPQGGDARRAQAIAAGEADVVVAGGMESMSNVPYYLPTARAGMRMGNQTVVDGMIHDGLWDAYNNFHMGNCAELCARGEGDRPRGAGRVRRRVATSARWRRRRRARSRPRSSPSRCRSARARPSGVDADEEPEQRRHREARRRCSRRSRRTARSPRATRRRSTTAPRRWCCAAPTSRRRAAGSRWRAFVAMAQARAGARVVHHRAGGGDRARARQGQARTRRRRPVGDQRGVRGRRRSPTTSCSGSTPSEVNVRRRRGGARPSRSAPRARASWRRCCTRWQAQGARRGVRVAVHRRRRRRRAASWSADVTRQPGSASSAPGRWGSGIAQVAAQAGHRRRSSSTRSASCAEQGRERRSTPPLDRLVEKGKLDGRASATQAMARIQPWPTATPASRAATSSSRRRPRIRSSRTKIFQELDEVGEPGAILASNTSSISITAARRATKRPGAGDRHALHEPGAGDEAGRDRARPGHRRRDLRGGVGRWRSASARRW